jgi:hypothetical protein
MESVARAVSSTLSEFDFPETMSRNIHKRHLRFSTSSDTPFCLLLAILVEHSHSILSLRPHCEGFLLSLPRETLEMMVICTATTLPLGDSAT